MEATRIFDLLDRMTSNFAFKQDILAAKEEGEWVKYSATDYVKNAYALSYGLLAMGLKPGDRIATVTNNRPEWNFLDMAMCQLGIIHVPVYPTISDGDFAYLLNHAEPRLLFVSDIALYNKLKPLAEGVSSIFAVVSFNEIEGVKNWKSILKTGENAGNEAKEELQKIKQSIKPDDVATIIYTSGTTGYPKGVMLSHRNILSNVEGICQLFHFGVEDSALSFLPLSHIFERTIDYFFQYRGVSIYYAENLGTIANNLKEIRPTVFISVPRVIERVYDWIIGKGKDLKGIKKQLFFWAVNLGLKFDFSRKNDIFYQFQLKIASKLIFSKWSEALGGRIKIIVAGGAATQPRLIRVFSAAGIPIVEGYGMTETSPVIAANRHESGEIMIGTVGPIFPGVEAKISDDGEILVKGPTVMLGYYKDTELTREIFDEQGWLRTGDIGVLLDDKYLKITDRKKEIFKLSSGKYISPQVIENKLKESFFIEQVFVFGENQKFASAIVVPNFPFVHNWCSKHGFQFRDNQELIQIPEVVKRFQREVNTINKQLGQTEQVKRFKLVHDDWSSLTGELSPTLKLKRRFLFEKYKPIIDDIYAVDSLGKD